MDQIRRRDFKGKEQRQDAYGTSVISIQMLKKGGFISIKNRYNHAVQGCDHTFDSNPDSIIEGLSAALKERFKFKFSVAKSPLPNGFVLMRNQIFKYFLERDNFYYGDQAWAKDGVVHTVDRSAGDVMFEGFLFDNRTKTLLKINPADTDSFADDFNRDYGGNRRLMVDKAGNLTLKGDVLIGIEESRVKTLALPALIEMGNDCLHRFHELTHFKALALKRMGDGCLNNAFDLVHFEAPMLTMRGYHCLSVCFRVAYCEAPALGYMTGTTLIPIIS